MIGGLNEINGLTVKNFNNNDNSVQKLLTPGGDPTQEDIDMSNIYSQGINFGTLDKTNN